MLNSRNFPKFKPFFLNPSSWNVSTRNRPKMVRKLREAQVFSPFCNKISKFSSKLKHFSLNSRIFPLNSRFRKKIFQKCAKKDQKNPVLKIPVDPCCLFPSVARRPRLWIAALRPASPSWAPLPRLRCRWTWSRCCKGWGCWRSRSTQGRWWARCGWSWQRNGGTGGRVAGDGCPKTCEKTFSLGDFPCSAITFVESHRATKYSKNVEIMNNEMKHASDLGTRTRLFFFTALRRRISKTTSYPYWNSA